MKVKIANSTLSEIEKRLNSNVCDSKKDIEDSIRFLADEDIDFENLIFDIGCEVVAKALKR